MKLFSVTIDIDLPTRNVIGKFEGTLTPIVKLFKYKLKDVTQMASEELFVKFDATYIYIFAKNYIRNTYILKAGIIHLCFDEVNDKCHYNEH